MATVENGLDWKAKARLLHPYASLREQGESLEAVTRPAVQLPRRAAGAMGFKHKCLQGPGRQFLNCLEFVSLSAPFSADDSPTNFQVPIIFAIILNSSLPVQGAIMSMGIDLRFIEHSDSGLMSQCSGKLPTTIFSKITSAPSSLVSQLPP